MLASIITCAGTPVARRPSLASIGLLRVSGAGLRFVNGVYRHDGEVAGAARFMRRVGPYVLRVSLRGTLWRLDAELQPAAQSVELYFAHGEPRNPAAVSWLPFARQPGGPPKQLCGVEPAPTMVLANEAAFVAVSEAMSGSGSGSSSGSSSGGGGGGGGGSASGAATGAASGAAMGSASASATALPLTYGGAADAWRPAQGHSTMRQRTTAAPPASPLRNSSSMETVEDDSDTEVGSTTPHDEDNRMDE